MKSKLSVVLTLVSFAVLLPGCNDEPQSSVAQEINETEPAFEDAISVSEVDNIISTMFEGRPKSRSGILLDYTVSTIKDSKGSPAIYVINLSEGGYVLVSATKDYNPVLAYCPKGKFELSEDTPAPLKCWIENTAEYASGNIELSADSVAKYRKMWKGFESGTIQQKPSSRAASSTGGISYDESVRLREIIADYETEWSRNGCTYQSVENFPDFDINDDQNKYKLLVEPHIYPRYIYDYQYLTYNVQRTENITYSEGKITNTEWGQEKEFNQSFPLLDNNKHAAAGCLTVAAAQLMYYYRHPATYNWDAMPKYYGNKVISDLMLEICTGAHGDYQLDSTPIHNDSIVIQLQAMGYNVSRLKPDNKEGVINELRKGHPVIASSELLPRPVGKLHDGHSWLISGGRTKIITRGYDEWWTFLTKDNFSVFQSTQTSQYAEYYLYYVNWGWYGSCDGYYADLDNIFPAANGPSSFTSIIYTDFIIATPKK